MPSSPFVAWAEHLLRETGRPLLVIWDGSMIHRRKEVKRFIRQLGRAHLWVEPLPAYAPDLNPVEWLWRHLKQVELRNFSCLDLEELHEVFHLAVARVRQKPGLVRSFFVDAGIQL